MTKDICVDNPHEVYLAQVLYNEMFKNIDYAKKRK